MNIIRFDILQLFVAFIIFIIMSSSVSLCSSLSYPLNKIANMINQTSADMYVFAYIWEPESCYENPTWSQCNSPQIFWGTNFVIHGLWPQYSSGGYPSTCTNEPFDNNVIDIIGLDTMNKYWPNVKSNVTAPDYNSFWQHEWTKHGTCSPLTQIEYFNSTIYLSKTFGTPTIITANVGNTVSADYIRSAFGGPSMVSLQCDNNYLSGVFTCWSMTTTNDGTPDKQITCPIDVQNEDTCSKDTIIITSFT
jgi:ribonuclease I